MRTFFSIQRLRWITRPVQQTILIFICALCLPLPALGQLSFSIGTVRQDTLYPAIEDCLGLVSRVAIQSIQPDTTFIDTLPARLGQLPFLRRENMRFPLVVSIAQQCSQKFTVAQLLAPDTLDVVTMRKAFLLLYRAERFPDALALSNGWLARVQGDTLREELRWRLVEQALSQMPTQFDVIRQLSAGFANTPFWWREVDVHGKLMDRAMALHDTTEVNRTIAWLIEIPTRLGESLLKTPEWTGSDLSIYSVGGYTLRAKEYVQAETRLAKLRESTASYREFQKALRKEMGLPEDSTPLKLAKPIIASYWIPEQPTVSRPTRGKIALVISQLRTNSCDECWMLKRLGRKFPEVEFTMVTRTHGQYGRYFGTLSTAEELRVLDSIHRKFQGFPGMIAVEETKFYRVDEQFDRRVIEAPGPNQEQYPTSGRWQAMVLIDRKGQMVSIGSVAFDLEETLELTIQALLNQKSEP